MLGKIWLVVLVVCLGGVLLMCFMDVPSRASFPPHFYEIVVEVKVLGPPHVLKLWLG